MPNKPDSREYPAYPIVGVGIIVLRGDRCLIVKRGHPPSQGAWSIPGGRVEAGETLGQAALRELAEECGPDVAVALKGIACVLERITRDAEGQPRYHFVLIDFAAEYVSGEPTAGDDAADVRWATDAELATLPTTPRLVEFVAEARERLRTGQLEQWLVTP